MRSKQNRSHLWIVIMQR